MTLEEAIKSRRSVRRFTEEPVPRETVLRLLDLARWRRTPMSAGGSWWCRRPSASSS